MLQLITEFSYGDFAEELASMYRLRYRVFKDRMGWDVDFSGDMEIDGFDALHPAYLIQRGFDGSLNGCVRLLPTTGPTMLRDTFPALLHGTPMPCSSDIWETSRFALDVPESAPKGAGKIAIATYELFAGVVEFGLANGIREIVTVTDERVERILRRVRWPLRRTGPSERIGNTMAVAGYVEISRDVLAILRQGGGLKGPVLWSPVVPSEAA